MFDKNAVPTQKVVRDWTVTDIRADDADGKPRISGHAAMFDTVSVNLGSRNWPWFEKIRSGAFAKTIREADIRSLWQHDVNFVLGRNKAGTLRLWEDQMGLAFEAFPPETDLVRDLVMAPIKRGDVDQMSFMFDAVQVNWIEVEGQAPVREIVEARLYEVSPVTFPAYTQTDVNARATLAAMGIQLDPLTQALLRADNGKLAESDRALVASVIGHLQGLLPSTEPPQAGHSDDAQRRKRQLELAEAESLYKE